FLAVYLACTLSAARTLAGGARRAALPAVLAVGAVLLFSGWALAIAAAVAVMAALRYRPPGEGRRASCPGGCAPVAACEQRRSQPGPVRGLDVPERGRALLPEGRYPLAGLGQAEAE